MPHKFKPVVAVSASSKTDAWPYWMLWDGLVNVTMPVMKSIGLPGYTFASRANAELLAQMYNYSDPNLVPAT